MSEVTEGGRAKGAKFLLNVVWNSLGMLATLVSGLLLSPYLIRKLGPDGYGVWALSFALIEYYWLLDLGFRSATIKYVAHYWTLEEPDKINEVISTALLYSSGAATFLVTGIFILAPWIQQYFQIAPAYKQTFVHLIMIVTVSWGISIVFGVFGAALEAVQRFDLSNRASIAATVLRTTGTFLLLYKGYGLIELSLMTGFAQILFFALQYLSFRGVFQKHHLTPRLANIPMLKQMMKFGVHSFVANVSQQCLAQSAPILIGHFLPAMFVGFYTLPVRLLQYTVELVARIGLVTNSSAAEMSASNDYRALGGLAIYSNRYSLMLFMPIAIFIATQGQALFVRWVGLEFAQHSGPVLPVLLVGSMIAIIGQFSSTMLLQGLAKHDLYGRSIAVEAVLGITTMWLVVPRYGIVGAAWVSTIFMIANRCLFTSWLTSRVVGIPILEYMNGIYAAPLLSAVPVFGLAWWLHTTILPGIAWLQIGEAAVVICIAYYCMAFFTVLSPAHRSMVTGWVGKAWMLRLNRA